MYLSYNPRVCFKKKHEEERDDLHKDRKRKSTNIIELRIYYFQNKKHNWIFFALYSWMIVVLTEKQVFVTK